MAKELLKDFNRMTKDEIKEEFIKYYGEEKLEEEERLAKLWPIELRLAEYLKVEPISS